MTSIEWLESMVNAMVDNGGDLGQDFPALKKHIQKAKEMHKAEQEKLVDEALTNYEIGWADRKAQLHQQEALFTEKDIMFAYMQGYNRGKDGNPNHMEEYITHVKSTKTSDVEISDFEIERQALTFAKEESYGELSTDLWKGYVFGAKRMRDRLKTKQ